MSDSVRPHRRQPTRLPRPWDSPGKNTGVGCQFLLQGMKVKSESESLRRVRLLATPRTAAYQAPPSMGFSSQEYWSGVPLCHLLIPLLGHLSLHGTIFNIKLGTTVNIIQRFYTLVLLRKLSNRIIKIQLRSTVQM